MSASCEPYDDCSLLGCLEFCDLFTDSNLDTCLALGFLVGMTAGIYGLTVVKFCRSIDLATPDLPTFNL